MFMYDCSILARACLDAGATYTGTVLVQVCAVFVQIQYLYPDKPRRPFFISALSIFRNPIVLCHGVMVSLTCTRPCKMETTGAHEFMQWLFFVISTKWKYTEAGALDQWTGRKVNRTTRIQLLYYNINECYRPELTKVCAPWPRPLKRAHNPSSQATESVQANSTFRI